MGILKLVKVRDRNQMTAKAFEHLSRKCIGVLDQGINLIGSLSDSEYCRESQNGSVGGHFRHILDFVDRFLEGIETGKIDYNKRFRKTRVESDRDLAIRKFGIALSRLNHFSENFVDRPLLTHLETGNYVCEETAWCETSLLRELEFVQSHTVHHYALIALKLNHQGILLPESFGVAPSTLKFWKQTEAKSAGA